MKNIKIKFVDFWYGFSPDKNYFFKLLSSYYNPELSDIPDILIFSCYGTEHLKYDCIKIYFTAENLRPDFAGCDYAISFDYNNHPRHYRLPLYALYIDQLGTCENLIAKKPREEAVSIWNKKRKFCCMVVSNGRSQKRLQFFEKLSEYKQVDSGGQVLNNVGGPVKNKMDFIKDYRFVIAFENSSYPGYTTEKIIEPLMADCIPLYWGDPLVNKEISQNCFLELKADNSVDKYIEMIKEIDQDDEKAIAMLMADKFVGNTIPDSINKQKLKLFFDLIIHDLEFRTPISRTGKERIYTYRTKLRYYKERVKRFISSFNTKKL